MAGPKPKHQERENRDRWLGERRKHNWPELWLVNKIFCAVWVPNPAAGENCLHFSIWDIFFKKSEL
jgi:hypothetical protein